MSYGFYIKMALTNIRKNARLYLPQMFTGAGLTAMFYILITLSMDERLREVRGGRYLPTIMPMGTVVVAILSAILVLYTNSFLMKQRKREFGLYTVLGLEKRHVRGGPIKQYIVLGNGMISVMLFFRFVSHRVMRWEVYRCSCS